MKNKFQIYVHVPTGFIVEFELDVLADETIINAQVKSKDETSYFQANGLNPDDLFFIGEV